MENEMAATKEVCDMFAPWYSQVCCHRRKSSEQRLHGNHGKLCRHPNTRRVGTRSGWQMVKLFVVVATLHFSAIGATKTSHIKATTCVWA